ncbi:MAG: MerR family transcriptional regulator [Micromonosporaceae bacterium]
MAWSIAQVARMSGVTSRTLRHYDDIGLLPPARIGGNGYRYYEQPQLLRLQEILVLRQLGLGLDAIAEIVQDGRDRVDALRVHHRALLAERDRFTRLADTVAQTIEQLEGGEQKMAKAKVEHWFDGFDAQTEAKLAEEAAERWGADAVQRSKESHDQLDKEQVKRQWAEQLSALVGLIEAEVAPDDPRVFEVLDGHHRWLANGNWTPDRESYTGLGNLYADEPRFRKNFDKTHPRLAEFLREAMAAYAQARLS